MSEFKKYRRKRYAELRPVTLEDIAQFEERNNIIHNEVYAVSISQTDRENNSPRIGDMIARNPENHEDQWLVAEKYFNDNFDKI